MSANEVVRRYANTVLSAAAEVGITDDVVRGDMESVSATIEASDELGDFLSNRLLSAEVKERAIEQLFVGKVQTLVANFLRLLARRRRATLLPEIVEACVAILDERSGVYNAEVRSAVELTAQQLDALRVRLSAYAGGDVRIQTQVDASLKGGVVARLGDTVFDGTIDMHLARLSRSLRGA